MSEALLAHALAHHPSREARAALRCGLGDAAVLCDMIAEEIRRANPGRRKGSVSLIGEELAAVAKRCGDRIMEHRDRISMPDHAALHAGHTGGTHDPSHRHNPQKT